MTPRPDFPKPYCVLPVNVIQRINEEQAYYDRDPEKAEREQKRRKEIAEEERQQEEARQYEDYQRESGRDIREQDMGNR